MKSIILHLLAFATLILIPTFNFAQATESILNTRIKPDVISQGMDIYPNPTTGIVTMKFISPGNDKYMVNVIDVTGKIVYNAIGIAIEGINQHEIDLSKEGKGIYLLKIKNGDMKEEKKIIVL